MMLKVAAKFESGRVVFLIGSKSALIIKLITSTCSNDKYLISSIETHKRANNNDGIYKEPHGIYMVEVITSPLTKHFRITLLVPVIKISRDDLDGLCFPNLRPHRINILRKIESDQI